MSDVTVEEGKATRAVAEAEAGKYLTFQLGAEVYGIAILKVQEIIGMMAVTRVPRTPPYVRGVINLRGKVIPVIDLRAKFGLDARADTGRTCIVVVQVSYEVCRVTMGIIVDEVSEVLYIEQDQIEPRPVLGTTLNTDFILGMGKVGDRVVMLLDVDKVLSTEEITTVRQVA
jgi:purine-binding chemotaxis protein CheW